MDGTFAQRYRAGEWRARLFADLVLADVGRFENPTVLDIGCGGGVAGSEGMQARIAEASGRYVGIEPDAEMPTQACVDEVHRCLFEEAPLAPASIHVALSVMVLEHVADASRFWHRLHDVLVPGGVFIGLTMDWRHYFPYVSQLAERAGLKDAWLEGIGESGDTYEHYPTAYRANSPKQILRYTRRRFRQVEFQSWGRPGDSNYYVPGPLKPAVALFDRALLGLKLPGSHLVCRLVK